MAEETVSIRQFAKDRGVSDTAIRKAIKAGKIINGRVFKNGVPCIIPSIAAAELDLYEASPTRGKAPKLQTPPTEKKPVKAAPTPAPPPAPPVALSNEPPKPPAGSLAAARLIQAQLKAKDMELDLRKKTGDLVEKKKVYEALFSFGQEIRATFQVIPDRHIDEILAAPSRNDAHAILYKVISNALETLADFGKRDITPKQ
jgi:hypothetical protein